MLALLFLLLGAAVLRPSAALACACGCGVFDVGASTVFPNDGDHGLANIAHLALGQDGMGWFFHGLATGVGDQPAARQAIDAVACDVLAIKNTDHARGRQSSFFVD